jgi:hypothetical protein
MILSRSATIGSNRCDGCVRTEIRNAIRRPKSVMNQIEIQGCEGEGVQHE